MTWDEVKEALRALLTGCESAERDRWLDTLTEANGGHHLGYSLLMDIRTESVDAGVICRAFDAMSRFPAKRMNDCFHEALCWLDETESELVWKKRAMMHNGTRCARVIDAADFVNYYYRSRGWNPARPADVRQAYMEVFFNAQGLALGTLDEPWSGFRGRVWVSPLDDVEGLSEPGDPERARKVFEALGKNRVAGAGERGAPLLGLVVYPEWFSSEVVKPTCLDATWQGDCFFVPYPPAMGKGWGKTCHTSNEDVKNEDVEVRERVHRKLTVEMEEFVARPLGEAYGVTVDPSAPLSKVRYRMTLINSM